MTVQATASTHSKRPRSLPMVSGGVPVFGHLFAFVRRAVDLLHEARAECGDVAAFKVAGKLMVLLTGPKANEAFFRAPDQQLSTADAYKMMVPVFGEDVVYDAPPEKMNEQLQMLMPALRDKRMRTYGEIVAAEVERGIADWGDEGEIDLVEYSRVLTNFTSSHCLLGSKFREEMTEEFAQVYHDLEMGVTPLAYIHAHLPLPSFRRRDRARVRLVEMITEIIENRRKSGEIGEDFLQTLMDSKYQSGASLNEHEITGLLLAAMFAGHHTSSVTTSWTLLELLHNPGCMTTVLDELNSVYGTDGEVTFDSLRQLHELEYAVKETIRLHPPLFLLMRGVRKEFEYDGYRVPKGAFLLTSPTVSHRIDEVFPDANRFDPSRFNQDRAEDKQPFSFISFGGGRHRCLGNAFAILQVKTIFAILLRRFEFAPVGDGMEPDFHGLVVGPKQPCRVRYKRRKVSAKKIRPTATARKATKTPEVENTEAQCPIFSSAPAPETPTIVVDRDLCQGHGVCMGEADSIFRVDDDGVLHLLQEHPSESALNAVRKAVDLCPTGALSLLETDD
jgi:sterol 14-demethylase